MARAQPCHWLELVFHYDMYFIHQYCLSWRWAGRPQKKSHGSKWLKPGKVDFENSSVLEIPLRKFLSAQYWSDTDQKTVRHFDPRVKRIELNARTR